MIVQGGAYPCSAQFFVKPDAGFLIRHLDKFDYLIRITPTKMFRTARRYQGEIEPKL
jgi:hypothetical protein